MNVLVVGSGAREHAIVSKVLGSSRVRDVYVAPGNAGTAMIARNLRVQADDIEGLHRAALENHIDLTIVGPENTLAAGIVDRFRGTNFRIFGPSQAAARIESSKAFAREVMSRAGVPHAKGEAFSDVGQARAYLQQHGAPVAVKADGLAAGKGVVVALTMDQALAALDDAMVRRSFGNAGNTVVIEDFLEGPEVSLLAFSDGKRVVPMAPATDYKRAYDADQGPNTGGMGAYSPPPFFRPDQVVWVHQHVLQPVIDELAQQGTPYVGILYAGLMLTRDGIKVIEFNCRFGDPETQVILPRLQTDLVDIAEACIDGRLDTLTVQWSADPCVGVVMTSGGYPGPYETGYPITGLDELDDGVRVYHAGTEGVSLRENSGISRLFAQDLPALPLDQQLSGSVQTSGGRVLTVVASGPTVEAARALVYRNLKRIDFAGAHYRTDVGLPPTEPIGELPDAPLQLPPGA
ncbi:MAG: phosphoribosylamine--glycine ligase [Dehalococcoidia bacterium]|nr:phosphoribosylamine--glycine ligase [Dehalococcoidia bacterium]